MLRTEIPDPLRAGVTGSCELPNLATGDQTACSWQEKYMTLTSHSPVPDKILLFAKCPVRFVSLQNSHTLSKDFNYCGKFRF